MELRDYLLVVRRRWLSAALVAVLVLAASVAATLLATPSYTATTRIYFGVQGSESFSDLAQGSTFAANQMASFSEVASSPLVLDRVIEDLGLATSSEQLARSVTVTVPKGTVIMEVSVADAGAGQAAAIANAVGAELIGVAANLSERPDDTAAGGADAVRATVLSAAAVPSAPTSPNTVRTIAIGLVLGLAGGLGTALLRQLLDPRVRDAHGVSATSDLPVLGSIVYDSRLLRSSVTVADEPQGAVAESIRRVRSNLQLLTDHRQGNALVVTSSVRGEGATATSLNLAVSLAATGRRVLLVDADLRQRAIAARTGLDGDQGLTTVLAGQAEVADVVQAWRDTSLTVLPAGPSPANPGDLLGSTRMAELVHQLGCSYDVVVLDAPPLLQVTDAVVLTQLVGSAVVVVDAGRLHRRQLRSSLAMLETAEAHVLGLLVTATSRQVASRRTATRFSLTPPRTAEPVADLPADSVVGPAVATRALPPAPQPDPVAAGDRAPL